MMVIEPRRGDTYDFGIRAIHKVPLMALYERIKKSTHLSLTIEVATPLILLSGRYRNHDMVDYWACCVPASSAVAARPLFRRRIPHAGA